VFGLYLPAAYRGCGGARPRAGIRAKTAIFLTESPWKRVAKKNGADGWYEFPSAQELRALGSAQVTTGYFGDLAAK